MPLDENSIEFQRRLLRLAQRRRDAAAVAVLEARIDRMMLAAGATRI